MTKDVEVAATSSLIEKTAKKRIKPGTDEKYDKTSLCLLDKITCLHLYLFMIKVLKEFLTIHKIRKQWCCVFDELSAISCIETIKQGFDVKIIICL